MRYSYGLWAFVLVIFAILVLLIAAIVISTNECNESGGEMVGNGVYTTTFVMSGKVMIPVVSEGMECSYENK